jgi:hypothetical protein
MKLFTKILFVAPLMACSSDKPVGPEIQVAESRPIIQEQRGNEHWAGVATPHGVQICKEISNKGKGFYNRQKSNFYTTFPDEDEKRREVVKLAAEHVGIDDEGFIDKVYGQLNPKK